MQDEPSEFELSCILFKMYYDQILHFCILRHAGLISSKLFHAIQMVETGGQTNPENVVGDGGKAIGPYQIHESYW